MRQYSRRTENEINDYIESYTWPAGVFFAPHRSYDSFRRPRNFKSDRTPRNYFVRGRISRAGIVPERTNGGGVQARDSGGRRKGVAILDHRRACAAARMDCRADAGEGHQRRAEPDFDYERLAAGPGFARQSAGRSGR